MLNQMTMTNFEEYKKFIQQSLADLSIDDKEEIKEENGEMDLDVKMQRYSEKKVSEMEQTQAKFNIEPEHQADVINVMQ